jgi:phage recombination protein Bet
MKEITYKARDGQEIKLSYDTIKKYLVSGRAEFVTESEFVLYMGVCKSKGFNPWIRDAYLVKYTREDNAAIITSIDYYRKRSRAQRDCKGWSTGIVVKNKKSGEIEFRDNCLFLESDEILLGGWFEALPEGFTTPIKKVVNLKTYIKTTKEGKPTRFWAPDKQPEMIAKVAESQGLRATWPDEFQGLYTDAEIQAEVDSAKGIIVEDAGRPMTDQKQIILDKLNGKKDSNTSSTPSPNTNGKKDSNTSSTPSPNTTDPRQDNLYLNYDPLSENLQKRYSEPKLLKMKDMLTEQGIEFTERMSGAELHQMLLNAKKLPEKDESPFQDPPEPDPVEKLEQWQASGPSQEELDEDEAVLKSLQKEVAGYRIRHPKDFEVVNEKLKREGTVRHSAMSSGHLDAAECRAYIEEMKKRL